VNARTVTAIRSADLRAQALDYLNGLYSKAARNRANTELSDELVHAADAFAAVGLISAEEANTLTDLDAEEEPQWVRMWWGWGWRAAA